MPDYIPDGVVCMYITGVCLILAAIAIILNNKFARIACYYSLFMLLIFICTIYVKPALDGNPRNLLTDISMAMDAIIIGNLAPGKFWVFQKAYFLPKLQKAFLPYK